MWTMTGIRTRRWVVALRDTGLKHNAESANQPVPGPVGVSIPTDRNSLVSVTAAVPEMRATESLLNELRNSDLTPPGKAFRSEGLDQGCARWEGSMNSSISRCHCRLATTKIHSAGSTASALRQKPGV